MLHKYSPAAQGFAAIFFYAILAAEVRSLGEAE
jgi:hypothetical protein